MLPLLQLEHIILQQEHILHSHPLDMCLDSLYSSRKQKYMGGRAVTWHKMYLLWSY